MKTHPIFLSCVYGIVQDHASGSLLVEEAGGIITDYRGRPLDFGLGRTLGTNYGVVAARKEVHAQVIEAVQAVLAEEATHEREAVRFLLPFFQIFESFVLNRNRFLLITKKNLAVVATGASTLEVLLKSCNAVAAESETICSSPLHY